MSKPSDLVQGTLDLLLLKILTLEPLHGFAISVRLKHPAESSRVDGALQEPGGFIEAMLAHHA